MQRVQVPQRFFSAESGSNSNVVRISERKNPVAEFAADEIGVFADKNKPGALRQIAFQQRPGIHIP